MSASWQHKISVIFETSQQQKFGIHSQINVLSREMWDLASNAKELGRSPAHPIAG